MNFYNSYVHPHTVMNEDKLQKIYLFVFWKKNQLSIISYRKCVFHKDKLQSLYFPKKRR